MPAGVILDLDGTVLRLELDVEEVRLRLAALFAPCGVNRPFRPILRRLHQAADEVARAGGDGEALRRAGLAILAELEEPAAARARPRGDAPEVARALLDAGLRLAFVTDAGARAARRALEAVGLAPERAAAIVTREDGPTRPDPAPVLAAAVAVGAPAWTVGAHRVDVEAGRVAAARLSGLRVAGIAAAPAARAALTAAGADAVLAAVGELPALLGVATPSRPA